MSESQEQTSPWSGLSLDFLSEGKWAIGQGPSAPDRQLFRALLQAAEDLGYVDLLEVGCGSGIDLWALASEDLLDAYDYTGYDLTPEFVAYLREHFPKQTFAEQDVLTMADEKVADVIWCRHVLEHVADGETALANLWRATRHVLLVSWFIRPVWSEHEVSCRESEGFLHQRYSAQRMVEVVRVLGAHLYRFDFDHHSTRSSVWMLSRGERPDLAQAAHEFLSSERFLRSIYSSPRRKPEREERLLDVLDNAEGRLAAIVAAADESVTTLERARSAVRSSRPLDHYDRFVFWGFCSSLDSMRHIYRHFVRVLDVFGKETLWIEDDAENLHHLRPGDLVFGVDVEGKELRAVHGVDYVLHNFDGEHPVWENLDDHRFLRLQTYTNAAEQYGVSWGAVRRYDHEARTLFQPWGTDLLAEEFMSPIFNAEAQEIAFVGAIWDDGGLGNAEAIGELETALAEHALRLNYLTQVSDEENVAAVRQARIAPAFAGRWQIEHDYLPCRGFKHPSWGVLALTNVPKQRQIFAGCHVGGETIAEMVAQVLDLSERDYIDLVLAQQQVVANYTYRESLEAISRALEEGR